MLELTKSDREDHSDKAVQTDTGKEERPARVLHAVGELQGRPTFLALPVEEVEEAYRDHETEVGIHESQAAQKDVRGGGLTPVTDQDGNDQDVGRESYQYVKGLHCQVEQDAFHHVVTTIKHTEGLRGHVQHRRGSSGIDGEVHSEVDVVWLRSSWSC